MNRFFRNALFSPLVWGGLLSLGFYAVLRVALVRIADPAKIALAERYFTEHPVEYVIVVLFFVGLVALVIKAVGVLMQYLSLNQIILPEAPAEGERISSARSVLDLIESLSLSVREGYLANRISQAMRFVLQKRSAAELDQHLWRLDEEDAARMHSSYSMVRIIVWAVPILGFLGTVLGLTTAISKLTIESLEDPNQVLQGLGVAFDTTALALALSLVLMFIKHFVEGLETGLLQRVNQRTSELLVGRFAESAAHQDPNVATIQRMAEVVIHSTGQLVERQSALWHESIDSAGQRWTRMTDSAGTVLNESLRESLDASLGRHAEAILQIEQEIGSENRRHWSDIQRALTRSAEVVAEQQSELVRQGEILRQVVDATGQVKRLEMALNENLDTLANANHFEETATSLAAAVQLLSARLGSARSGVDRVEIQTMDSVDDAA